MADELMNDTPKPRRCFGRPFAKGHARLGGRKKKDTTIASALATAERLGFNAIELGIKIVLTGKIAENDGTQTSVDIRSRLKLLRELAAYIHPKAPTLVAGQVDHTHAHKHIDMTAIMHDPVLAAAAQQLAIAMAEQEVSETQNERSLLLLNPNVYQKPYPD